MKSKMSTRVLAIMVMIVTPLFFSTNLIFGRLSAPEVGPNILAFIRWSLVALVLLPFLLREAKAARTVVAEHFSNLVVLGILGMLICGSGVYLALGYTTATNGTLIYTSSSVLILVIEALFLGRRIGAREALGSMVAFAGVATIVLRGDPGALLRLDFNVGDLLFVAAAISWAAYSVLYRQRVLSSLSNMALFALVASVGALVIAPFALVELLQGGQVPATRAAWIGVAGIVMLGSLLAFSGFQYGVRVLGPSLAGVFMYLLPPYGVGLAVAFLGESFEGFHAIGIALVTGGVVLATFPGRQPR